MMRVLVTDASVVVDLLARFAAEPIEMALFGRHGQLVAPELLDIEVLHTLRKLETTEAIPASCVFQPKLDTDSGPKWTGIPEETGQGFRRKLDTDSGVKLDSISGLTGIVS